LSKEKIILGIDPGTTVMGFGVIIIEEKEMRLLEMGVLHLSKYSDHALKLQKIFKKVVMLIETYHPDELAIEAPFFGKNVQSMLKLGRAQGVAIAAALSLEIPIKEYAPKSIKQSITGNGNASKEQVAKMLQYLLKIETLPDFLDATDGLAAAVCHFFNGKSNEPSSKKSSSGGWKAFIADNPKRKIG
jgi:crossover junction endodeoxyribonuclease RuvC